LSQFRRLDALRHGGRDQNKANGPEDDMSEQTSNQASDHASNQGSAATTPATSATPATIGASADPAASPMAKAMSNAYASASDPMIKDGMSWCVLRVASNKESSVRDTLLRKVQIEKMEHLVSRILVPTEKTKTIKGGKQKVTETKLYPGYVFVEMKLEDDKRIPQDVFFLIKETTGVGDFVGTKGFPTPMKPVEIEKMLQASLRVDEQPQIKLVFEKGEAVTIKEGPFQGYEGTVDELIPDKGLVRVLVTIFGRQAPVELEEWQIGKTDEQ
jgi:transcription termination/antitermination protein NusG